MSSQSHSCLGPHCACYKAPTLHVSRKYQTLFRVHLSDSWGFWSLGTGKFQNFSLWRFWSSQIWLFSVVVFGILYSINSGFTYQCMYMVFYCLSYWRNLLFRMYLYKQPSHASLQENTSLLLDLDCFTLFLQKIQPCIFIKSYPWGCGKTECVMVLIFKGSGVGKSSLVPKSSAGKSFIDHWLGTTQ